MAVVRALINRPSLLLADQPTGSLNQKGAHELAQLLLDLNREEAMALIVVTHSMAVASLMGRVLELQEGALRSMNSLTLITRGLRYFRRMHSGLFLGTALAASILTAH